MFTGIFRKRLSEKLRNIHRKTPALESLFNKVEGFKPATLLKGDSNTHVFL